MLTPMKRIYISGPMTGRPQLNFPAFNAEAARLRDLGYEVVNPAEINKDQDADWHACLRADLAQLLTCDTLALLPDWHASAGAHLETHVAHRVGIRVIDAAAITLKREEFLHQHNGMPDVRFVEVEPAPAEQEAWHAGLAAGRDIESGNAAAAAGAVFLLAGEERPDQWYETNQSTYEWWKNAGTRVVWRLYTAPVAAQAHRAGVVLSGAQLLQALDFIAPDQATDASQLETEAHISFGDGHSGRGYYASLSEYPEEGAVLLDGQIAPPQPASGVLLKNTLDFFAAKGVHISADMLERAARAAAKEQS